MNLSRFVLTNTDIRCSIIDTKSLFQIKKAQELDNKHKIVKKNWTLISYRIFRQKTH